MRPARFREQPARWWLLGSVLVALLSLPLGHALAFDASAWVVWGREVWHLGLDTGSGPSWKPFPVLFTAPLAVLGDATGAAWLVIARSGALMGIVGAALLARRTAGPWAIPVTVATIVCSPWWLLNGALGNADPLLGALVVWGLLAAGEQRHRSAFALGVLGALIRPEAWPFLAGYGLWLVVRRRMRLVPVLAAGAAVLLLWIVPDLLASGLASTTGATGTPSPSSASLTKVPFLTVWKDLWAQSPWPALLAALLAVTVAVRRGRWRAEALGWAALVAAYTLLVAVMAQAGFAGNPRYLVPALTLLAATAGTTVGIAGRRRFAPPAIALVLVAVLLAVGVGDVRSQARTVGDRAAIRRALIRTVDAAGGPDALQRHGPVRSAAPGWRSLVAEVLHESVPDASHRPRLGEVVARPTPGGGWSIR